MTSQILDLVYTAKVREDEGGTYGVYVGGQLSKYPKEKALLQIVFETAPAKEKADADYLCRTRQHRQSRSVGRRLE